MKNVLKYSGIVFTVVFVTAMATFLVYKVKAQSELAPRVPRTVVQTTSSYDKDGVLKATSRLELSYFANGSVVENSEDGVVSVNDTAKRSSALYDTRTGLAHVVKWQHDGSMLTFPLRSNCLDNEQKGTNETVFMDAKPGPVIHGMPTSRLISTAPGAMSIERIRYVAADNGCIDLGSETRGNGVLRTKKEPTELRLGEPDVALLQLPSDRKEVTMVEYLRAYHKARGLKPVPYPEGHPLHDSTAP